MMRIGFGAIGLAIASIALAQPRPAGDSDRDAARKPAEMIAFAGIKSGSKVADLIPGGGYFTRVYSAAVGSEGVVYALVPATLAKSNPETLTNMQAIAAEPGYGNVKVITWSVQTPPPEQVDVVWTSQNYHDLHNAPAGSVEAVNRATFAMLKPGGTYVVLDHAASAGSGARDTKTLHRIDPATVKAEVLAAGFVFDGESEVLRNPKDPLTAAVFDPAIRGKTDQFLFRFRKPKM